MRGLIAAILRRDPEIEVVGSAGDPLEARQAIKLHNPDVITLDVEMPNMNGIEFLEKIMRLRPMPVVMVSTLTHAGADASIAALEIGAVDCVGKPTASQVDDGFNDLAMRVKAAAQAKVRAKQVQDAVTLRSAYRGDGKIVAIGSSTGGVEALLAVLTRFPKNCPPTLITQHMPPSFTRSLADRLNRICAPEVAEATDGAPVLPGRVYIAPGGDRHLRIAGSSSLRCVLVDAPPESGHRPSVDILFRSVAQAAGAGAVGVILTGMGRDGADGLLAMRNAGAVTIGQDEASCIVYGMPKVAHQIGGVQRQLPLHRIADGILDACEIRNRKAS
jgi:two-component system chemotaxis response regulator CheB